jgi:hypothetical protein
MIMMNKAITAAVAGVAVLSVPTAALATDTGSAGSAGSTAWATFAGPTKLLHLRKGLTLTVPKSWKVYEQDKDWLRVVTGPCPTLGTDMFGFRDSGCHSFWVMGPKAIKMGHEFFHAYTPAGPFYPASDIGPCPFDKRLWLGHMSLSDKGLRQVGPGHKADYRKWSARCVTKTTYKPKGHFTQREWFLPASKILVIDRWDTPELSGILTRATWR